MTLNDLASRLGCDLIGDGTIEVVRLAPLGAATAGDLSFAIHKKHFKEAETTRASALIVPLSFNSAPCALLRSRDPRLALADAQRFLAPVAIPAVVGISNHADIHPSAILGEGVAVGAFAIIGPRANIGRRTVIYPHVVIGREVRIGAECTIHSHVSIRESVSIGRGVVIQDGAVIGSEGFGYARRPDGSQTHVLQLGSVEIGDEVEIGANATIDRAPFLGTATSIGRGTKIDNLVQIGHNVQLGRDVVLCAQVGIGGSARLGDRVVLAGQVGVADNVNIADGVTAAGQSGITSSFKKPNQQIAGYPAVDIRQWRSASAVFPKLPTMRRLVRSCERFIGELRKEE